MKNFSRRTFKWTQHGIMGNLIFQIGCNLVRICYGTILIDCLRFLYKFISTFFVPVEVLFGSELEGTIQVPTVGFLVHNPSHGP